VKGNFQARFWNSGGQGDLPTDCGGMWIFLTLSLALTKLLSAIFTSSIMLYIISSCTMELMRHQFWSSAASER
jgi:hypothetical protein